MISLVTETCMFMCRQLQIKSICAFIEKLEAFDYVPNCVNRWNSCGEAYRLELNALTQRLIRETHRYGCQIAIWRQLETFLSWCCVWLPVLHTRNAMSSVSHITHYFAFFKFQNHSLSFMNKCSIHDNCLTRWRCESSSQANRANLALGTFTKI